MNLDEIRSQIDQIDTTIFIKISERLELVQSVVQWKEKNGKEIYDAKREEIIINEKRQLAEQYGFSADTAEEILRAIIAESHLQEKKFLQDDETSPRKIRRKKIPHHPELLTIFEQIVSTEKNFFFLESLGSDEWSQQSLMGFAPKKIFAAKGKKVFINGVEQTTKKNPIQWLQEEFAPYQHLVANSRERGFAGGLVGSINYEAVQYFEPSIALESHKDFYDFEFGLYLDGLIYNRKTEELEYVFADEDRSEKITKLLQTTAKKNSTAKFSAKATGSNFTDEELDEMIDRCKEEIVKGNIFQIVPSRKFFYDAQGSALEFYKKLRISNPSPNMFFINFEDRKSIASSPEMIAKVEGKRIETYPIAGTRSRGRTPQEDAKLSAKMLSDEKEVAEHLMLVDMARNDLGRIAQYGSVVVEETMALKKYSHVQHLVSRVSARIKDGVSSFEAAMANFPMGTVSGSPRLEAIKIINKLEKNSPRGPYAGGAGYWSVTGDLQLSLAIRGLFIAKGKGFSQAGAGIVFDSVAQFEREEIEKKSMNVRSLLGK